MNEYIKIALQADPAGLIQGFAQAEGAVQKFAATATAATRVVQAGGQMYEQAQKSIRKIGVGLGGVSLANVAYFAKATNSAAKLQTQLKNVQSLTKVSNEELGMQGKQILEMSTKLPQTAEELSAGLYDIVSSGFEGADAMEILDRSSVAASAGMTNAATATEAVVAALNAYGLGAEMAADVSDTMFQTVNLGVVRFEELASGMGQWVGMAAQLGVEYDEAMANLATMTLSGIKPDQSATYLSRVMQSFLQTTEVMENAVQDLGYGSAKAMLDAEGLGESVLKLHAYSEAMAKSTGIDAATAFNDMFGSIQASRGAMAIAANEGQNYARVAAEITNQLGRAGAAQDAFGYQAESISMKWQQFKNAITAVNITIGEQFLGPLGMGLDMATAFVEKIFAIPEALKDFGGALAVIGTGITAALSLVLALVPGIVIRLAAAKIAGIAAGKAIELGFARAGTVLQSVSDWLGTKGMIKHLQQARAQMMRFIRPLLTLKAAMTGIAIGTVIEAFYIKDDLAKAADEGERLASVFAEGLDTSTWMDSFAAVKDLRQELADARQDYDEMYSDPQESHLESIADTAMSFIPFLGDAAQKRNNERSQQEAYIEGLEEEVAALDQRQERLKAFAAMTMMPQDMKMGIDWDYGDITTDPDKIGMKEPLIKSQPEGPQVYKYDDMGHPLDAYFDPRGDAKGIVDYEGVENQMAAMFDNIAEEGGRSADSIMMEWDRLAAAEGFSLEDFLPEEVGSEQAEANLRSLADAYHELSDLSPNMSDAKISFKEIAESADNAKSNIDKLGEAMAKYVENSLGPMMARDALEGLVNDTYQMVQEIKTESDLSEAMNFESFHEDALALRSNWADITQGMIDDTVAWAQSQGEVTASDINLYLQESINRMREYGREMGLSSEFVERFVGDLQSVITNGDIDIAFNTDIADASAELERFLITSGIAKMGDNPKGMEFEIQTQFKTPGVNMTEYLQGIGAKDQQITIIMELLQRGAWDSVNSLVDDLTEADNIDVIETVVDVLIQTNGSPTGGDIEDIASQFDDLDVDDVNMIISAMGNANDFLGIVSILQSQIEEKDEQDIIVNAETAEALTKLGVVRTEIETLPDGRVHIRITSDPMPSIPGASMPPSGSGSITSTDDDRWGSIRRFAQGGIESPGMAQIYKPMTPYRIFAEPETGGEAYIPLASGKRNRSLAILGSVAGMFGYQVTRFGDGGLAGRFRSDKDGDSGGGGGSKSSGSGKSAAETQKEAAEEQKKAAEDQQKAAEEARKRDRDIWNYKYEIEWSLGPVERIGNLLTQMQGLEAYSDEWMEIGRAVKDASQEMQKNGEAAQDFFYEAKIIDSTKYLELLESRASSLRAFTSEWWDLGLKIHKQKRQILEDQWDLEDVMNDTGNQSDRNRIGQLMRRMAHEKAYSKEWWELRNEVMDLQWDMMAAEVKYGKISKNEYEKFLRERLTTVEKYSSSWQEIMDELTAIQREGLENTADLFNKFNGRMALSSGSVIKYLERQIKVARQFNSAIEQIRSSGALDANILQSLIDMGPSGLGLAVAIADAIAKGQGGTINDLLQQATDLGNINAASYDRGGYLPPGYTLAYNGTGKPERVGGGDTYVNLNFHGDPSETNIERAAQRVKFVLSEAS